MSALAAYHCQPGTRIVLKPGFSICLTYCIPLSVSQWDYLSDFSVRLRSLWSGFWVISQSLWLATDCYLSLQSISSDAICVSFVWGNTLPKHFSLTRSLWHNRNIWTLGLWPLHSLVMMHIVINRFEVSLLLILLLRPVFASLGSPCTVFDLSPSQSSLCVSFASSSVCLAVCLCHSHVMKQI